MLAFCFRAFWSECPSHPHLLHAWAVLRPALVPTNWICLGGNSVKSSVHQTHSLTPNKDTELQPANSLLDGLSSQEGDIQVRQAGYILTEANWNCPNHLWCISRGLGTKCFNLPIQCWCARLFGNVKVAQDSYSPCRISLWGFGHPFMACPGRFWKTHLTLAISSTILLWPNSWILNNVLKGSDCSLVTKQIYADNTSFPNSFSTPL